MKNKLWKFQSQDYEEPEGSLWSILWPSEKVLDPLERQWVSKMLLLQNASADYREKERK